jgi:hypothetical protein
MILNTNQTPGCGRVLALGLGKFIETLPFVADNAGELSDLLRSTGHAGGFGVFQGAAGRSISYRSA